MTYNLVNDLTLTWEEQKILKDLIENHKKFNTYKGKYIICNETGERFRTRKDVAKKYGLTLASVSRHLNGIQKTLKKLTFKEIKAD